MSRLPVCAAWVKGKVLSLEAVVFRFLSFALPGCSCQLQTKAVPQAVAAAVHSLPGRLIPIMQASVLEAAGCITF